MGVLVDRCPACSKPVAEADTVCPYCSRDFSAAAARKVPQRPDPEPEREVEAPEPARPPAARVPTPQLEEEEPPAPRNKPRLEEREPSRVPEPSSGAGFEIDNPPAYVPGTFSNSTPVEPYKAPKEPARPPWQWLAMGVVCILAIKFVNVKGPAKPPPQPAPAPVASAEPTPPPALPPDAKDAAAASVPATPVLPPTPPRKPGKRHRETPQPVQPDEGDHAPDESSISIVQAAPEDEPRRRAGPAVSNEWRMRGAIFDLLTAEPVKGADVVFMDAKTGRQFRTGTDAQGKYRATLPVVEEGYDLNIRHPKYEPKYFEDGVPSYRELGHEQRQSAATDLLRILQTKEMIVGQGGTVLQRDYVVIPLERP